MNHPFVDGNKLVVFATTDTCPPLSARAQRQKESSIQFLDEFVWAPTQYGEELVGRKEHKAPTSRGQGSSKAAS